MLGLRHLALRVRDIHRSLDFYTGILKMKVVWHPDPRNVYLTTGNDNLALHQTDDESVVNGAAPGLDHFGFLVSRPKEVDEWAAALEERSVSLVQKPKVHRDGSVSIYFRDPDGNLIQILHHPDIREAAMT